jgi:hypothetical protein
VRLAVREGLGGFCHAANFTTVGAARPHRDPWLCPAGRHRHTSGCHPAA